MLQIIGWLGCLYLFVKGLEIAGSASSYQPSIADSEKLEMRTPTLLAILLAVAGSLGFALWLAAQGSASGEQFSDSVSEIEANTAELERQNACALAASDPEDIMACYAD